MTDSEKDTKVHKVIMMIVTRITRVIIVGYRIARTYMHTRAHTQKHTRMHEHMPTLSTSVGYIISISRYMDVTAGI